MVAIRKGIDFVLGSCGLVLNSCTCRSLFHFLMTNHCVLRASELSVVYQKTVTSWQPHLSSSQLATATNVLLERRLSQHSAIETLINTFECELPLLVMLIWKGGSVGELH